MHALYDEKYSHELVKRYFKALDADKDKYIDYDEFMLFHTGILEGKILNTRYPDHPLKLHYREVTQSTKSKSSRSHSRTRGECGEVFWEYEE